jgi:hypothetical protein
MIQQHRWRCLARRIACGPIKHNKYARMTSWKFVLLSRSSHASRCTATAAAGAAGRLMVINRPLVSLDLETTGLRVTGDRIIGGAVGIGQHCWVGAVRGLWTASYAAYKSTASKATRRVVTCATLAACTCQSAWLAMATVMDQYLQKDCVPSTQGCRLDLSSPVSDTHLVLQRLLRSR